MQTAMSTKKQERNERKRKKLAALATIVELNENDDYVKAHRARSTSTNEGSGPSNSDENDGDHFVKVTHNNATKVSVAASGDGDSTQKHESPQSPSPTKKKSKKPLDSDSPTPKRKRFNSSSESSQRSETNSPIMDKWVNNKVLLNESQLNGVQRLIDTRKKEIMHFKEEVAPLPVFTLHDIGVKALINVPQNQRVPIFLTDIQHLIMTSLLGEKSPCIPNRWCNFDELMALRQTVVVLLEGCSLFHYLSNEDKFERANNIFKIKVEMVMPPYKPNTMIEEILKVPLTTLQADDLIEKHGSLEAAIDMVKDPTLIVNRIFNIKENKEIHWEDLHPEDKFPRTKLLLSALQMVEEGYPLPLTGEFESRCSEFIMTKDVYDPVTNHSPLYGLDCEMCRTVAGVNELTRISIVNENLETVYETLVRPDNKIVDYLTKYSGITAEIMSPVTKTLKDVQREVRELLPPDAILVGQSLQSDLNAMHMMHPYVIDTSVIFNMSGDRKRKSKLQKLALTFLQESIQAHAEGHDSIEDSIATMKLVKLKLAKSIEFGDQILNDRRRYHDILRIAKGRSVDNNLLGWLTKLQRSTSVVSSCPIDISVKNTIEKCQADLSPKLVSCYELQSNKDVFQKTRELVAVNNLVIANLKITDADLRLEKCVDTVQQLDKWISKIWKSITKSALFIVLMGGTSDCPNGLAKIAVKLDKD